MRNLGMIAKGLLLLSLVFVLRADAQTNDLVLVDHAETLPGVFSFHSLQKYLAGIRYPPLPFNPFPDRDLYRCDTCNSNHVIYFYDDQDVDYQIPMQRSATQSAESESGEGDNDWQPAYNYPSNSLYLEITGLSSNLDTAFLLVHGTHSGEIYELKSTVLLTNQVLTAWSTEQAVHGSNDVTATSVSLLDRTNTLFFWARLWTTNDENSNSIPDWWEWENFGNLNQSTNDDYDGDLINNFQEYLAGSDPNTISFSITAPNSAVSISGAPLHLAIFGGVPSSMAILVDSTNFAAANWTPFSADITANLGSTEGWHEVWIGLRGRKPNSQQTWRKTRIKLDVTPPLLVITNPLSASVSRPIIQLQGYSAEPLASLTYDLTNAAGLVTNQLGLVIGQAYTTNTWECTTNFFQAFDVPLTSGNNTITLRATDLAGNTSVTNITLSLDYSSKTNPPSLRLQWPQNGTQVASNSFAWRGRLDDQTVEIVAQLSDGVGGTNSVAGTVRRDGQFRIENLPLVSGTNFFTLLATDAAGNQTTTNVYVIKSALSMAINSLSWFQASGTISGSNYKVWLNGKQATLDGSGGWSADVHLTLSNPTLQVRAVPNSDNGGNGSGGGGAATSDNSGNPDSTGAVDCEAGVSWTDGFVMTTAQFYSENQYSVDDYSYWETNRFTDSVNWSESGGGTEDSLNAITNYLGTNILWYFTESWPGEELPQLPDGFYTSLVDGITYDIHGPPEVVARAGGAWHAQLDYGNEFFTWTWHEDDQVTLVTADSTEPELYTISGNGEYLIFPAPGYPFVNPGGIWPNLPPEQIAIGSYGNLDTNGNLLVVLPPRTTLDITPRASGGGGGSGGGGSAAPANTGTTLLGVTAQKDAWISETIATTPANRSRTNIGVGEEVKLYWNPPPYVKPIYSVSGGSIRQIDNEGWVWQFTAPSNKATITITATFPRVKKTRVFQVGEPTGLDHADFLEYDTADVQNGVAGVGVHLKPYIGPTNVSFYRVQVMEVGTNASNISGYFATNTPPDHDTAHGANDWGIQLGQDNSWPSRYDLATSFGWHSPWSNGGYTWDVPARWKIGSGPTNSMPGWNQVFTINASGTMTVSKFGHTVTRTAPGTYSGQ